MKRGFYKKVSELLNENGEAYLVSIINGKVDNKDITGQKLIKSKEHIILEDDSFCDFWTKALTEIDFDRGTYIFLMEDEIEVFVEYLTGSEHLVICGGGHIALPLCEIGKVLGFEVTVIDDREEFASKERFYMADNVICKDFKEALKEIKYTKNTYFTLVTRGHKSDMLCLEEILKCDNAYLGMIGSRSKIAIVMKSMIEKGYKQEALDKIYTPVGLKIGAKTPAEIAVSISAEIVQVRNERASNNIEFSILRELSSGNREMILASIVESRGSVPRGVGSKMIIFNTGEFLGTIGGGAIENAVLEKSLELIKNKESYAEDYNLSNSSGSKLGMSCGGEAKVLFEYIG